MGGDGRPSGVPRHILHLAGALQDVAALTVISDKDEGGFTALGSMPVRHKIISGLTRRLSIRHNWRGISTLLDMLKSEPADLVWIHARLQVLVCRLFLAFRIWKPACPVVFTHHGLPYGPGYHPVIHRICKALERMLVAICPPQNLVFLDHRMAGEMAQTARARRLARHRIHIMPNCSDLRPLPSEKTKGIKRLVMTGRTGRQKDYDLAVRLLAELPPHFYLTLCGPGTEDAGFQSDIATLIPQNVFERITFTGPLLDVRQPLSTADAYLLTSRYEGTPIGALEAFEAGLPIILRDFDGASDLVRAHPCAVLMNSGNLPREAERIVRMLAVFERHSKTLPSEIKMVWQAKWAPAIFSRNARALVRSVLRSASDPVVMPDCIRDAPKRHQDRRKNAAGHVPVPPPCYTTGAPSAENGLQQ